MTSAIEVDRAIHYSYLLRLWQVPANGEDAWRIQLENVLTGEKRGFASLEELLSYLSQVTTDKKETCGDGSESDI